MKKNFKEILLLIGFIGLFIFIHTLYYKNLFVFVHDQVSSSTKAMELWKTKSFTLIGPPLSFSIENRQIYFGSLCYYIQLFFLLVGKFDPFWSTYSFMIFSALMIVPLYLGMKSLINKKAAIMMIILYSLLPFYIESTHTLWNPYFLFSLLPTHLFLISRFVRKENPFLFLAISVLNGVLFQLHYMFIFVILGQLIFFFLIRKISWKYLAIFVAGAAIGIGNLILFEMRHGFYLLKTFRLYLTHPKQITGHWFADYYLLSESFYALVIFLYWTKKLITGKTIIVLFILLSLLAFNHVALTAGSRHYPKDWYYEDELKAYSIIKTDFMEKNFNIFEFYNATGDTQKYFLKRDGAPLNYNDYYYNQYLYVIYKKGGGFTKDPAYEIGSFQPSKIINEWKINNYYNLYLLKRI